MGYKNKEDQKIAAAKHYENNKSLVKDRAVKFKNLAKERNREFVEGYLSTHPCIDCGETDIVVLEFDHIKDDKINNISDGINRAWSIKKLQDEINKCEVRCANCHRRITYNRRIKGN